MAFPEVVSREQWLEARLQLLTEEKNATRRRDALNSARRRLPMVRIEKDYVFEGPQGQVGLGALFGDSRQLIVQHIMFGPDWDAACPACTVKRDAGHELLPARGRRGLPHVLDLWARQRVPVELLPMLDLTALGRQEGWEEPEDRAPAVQGPG